MFVLLSHFEQSVSILRIIIIEKEPTEYSRDQTIIIVAHRETNSKDTK